MRVAWWPAIVGVGALLAFAIVGKPVLAALGLSAMALALLWRYSVPRTPRLFAVAIGILLIGYAFFGRAFAYLGAPPVYVGELVLVVGLVSVAATGRLRVLRRSPTAWLLLAFATWGAVCTVPFIPRYGWDSLRDAVVWGYGMFLPLVAASLLHTRYEARVIRAYARLVPWLLVWTPVAVLVGRYMPYVPAHLEATNVPVIGVKPGDAAVHLAGAAAFLILGLHRSGMPRRASPFRFTEPLLWLLFVLGFTVSASLNRGGLLSVLVALAVLAPWVPIRRWWKPVVITASVVCALLVFDVDLDLGGARRISVHQLAQNLKSLSKEDASFAGTKRWRLEWWQEIVDYTVFGEYFWTGKGFGVNLAEDDGYQTPGHGSLRSPHNGHVAILARSGVPGFVLWSLLHFGFARSLLRGVKRDSHSVHAKTRLWVLVYWTAFMVNSAFDVFLEGPQAGICFWSLMGYGVALLESQRTADDELARPS